MSSSVLIIISGMPASGKTALGHSLEKHLPIPLYNQLIEFFIVPSWEEHLRQHTERLTGTDRQFEERADALSNPPSRSVHLIGVDIPNE